MNTPLPFLIKTCFYVVISWVSLTTLAYSQEESSSHESHAHSDIELGLSIGYARLEEEKIDGTSLHVHIMKRLSGQGIQRYFSIGAGVETILASENHFGAMLSVAAHPTDKLTVTLSQGIEWADHEGDWESSRATHIEASYLFEGEHFHYGPVIGYSKTPEKQHYKVGIHFGIPLY
ncbi:MAG: hypothetical protein L3J01_04450 [Thiomicrorhabdus sp.]|nr:hypothetical protein [Thiomicrorhabdus sp.]